MPTEIVWAAGGLLAIACVVLGARTIVRRRELGAVGTPAQGRGATFWEVFEAVGGGYFKTTPDGRLVEATGPVLRILGFDSIEQLMQEAGSVRDLYLDPSQRDALISRLSEDGSAHGFEIRARRRDSSPVWVSLDAIVRRSADGTPVSIEGLISDISERKDAQAAMQEAQERYRTLVESIPAIIWADELDARSESERRTVYANPQIAEVLGFQPEEFADDPQLFETLYHPEDAERMRRVDERHRATGNPVSEDYRMVSKDGRTVWVHEESRVVRGSDDRRMTQGLLIDVTASKEVEDLLIETRAHEVANAAKNEFLSRMSHELRTPLNAILGFGQLLESAELAPDDRESVDNVVRAGKRLKEMIDEILEISRLETGRRAMSLEPIRVAETVTEAAGAAGAAARARAVRVVLEVEDAVVLADREALKQIVLNLLSNAVKFTRQPGTVTVRGEVTDGGYELAVTDQGPGITPEDQPQVFKPFARLGVAAEHPDVAGPGLGLALAKGLAVSMRGDLSFTSEPGAGATFRIRLLTTEAGPLTPADKATRSAGARRTVLHIEDNPSSLELIQRILEYRPQTEVIAAPTGAMGLDLARSQAPDAVLLDINLPDISGDDVLRRLKADPATRHIPVLVLSAHASPGRERRMKEAGAAGYMTKPIEVHRFLEAMHDILDPSH